MSSSNYSRRRQRERKQRKIKRTIVTISSILFLLMMAIGAFSLYTKSKLDKITGEEYTTQIREETIEDGAPIGVLLLGTDSSVNRAPEEGERSDTMIYMTINPQTKKTHLYSISRDLLTWVDTDNYQKINAAYGIGQEAQTAKAVEYLLNAPIDYYISVNMDALVEVINALGGIDVVNNLGFPISISDMEPQYTETIDVGPQHITGEQALVYARMRYQDPEGDVGRQKRQQEVINQVISKLKDPTMIVKLDELLNIATRHVRTNATGDLIKLFTSYKNALENIESTSIIGRGEMINEIYYMIAGRDNIKSIQKLIREELGLPFEDLSWRDDLNMLSVNDTVYDLDVSPHYDEFTGYYIIGGDMPIDETQAVSEEVVNNTAETTDVAETTPSTEEYVEEVILE